MNTRKPSAWPRFRLLAAVLALVLVVVGIRMALRPASDGLESYPHAFLAEPGYDPNDVQFVIAPFDASPPAPTGCLPAWQCDDPAFQDSQSRPWLFPAPIGAEKPTMPEHPQLKRSPDLKMCHRYRSPEGERQLELYRAGHQP